MTLDRIRRSNAGSEVRPMQVGGQALTTSGVIHVRDPDDGSWIADVPEATLHHVELAVATAQQAAVRARTQPAHLRAAWLRSASLAIKEQEESLAITIAREGIKTIREAQREVDRCATTFNLAAVEAERLAGEVFPFDAFPDAGDRIGYWTREPHGVVVGITPFNDPLNLVAHKAAPAIASGNAIIIKPHPETPLSALALAELLLETGLPSGLIQVITGGAEIGEALVSHAGVDMVSFTGGRVAGDHVARSARAKRLLMELGGNSATIVLSDVADLNRCVASITRGAFTAAGQNCLHVQRVMAASEVYVELRERLVAEAQAIRTGRKLDESTDMGPLINEQAVDRVTRLLEGARARGAEVLTGGRADGNRMAPTFVEKVPSDHALAVEEVFAPVTILESFEELDEAIARANEGGSNLQTGVFTSSIETAFDAAKNLRSGAVMINDCSDFRVDAMPFGGVGHAGIGREGVRYAIEAMTEPKLFCVKRES